MKTALVAVAGLLVVLSHAGCASSAGPPETKPRKAPRSRPRAATETEAAKSQGRLPACRDARDDVPELTAYGDVEPPARYWVDMVFQEDTRAWRPATHISMPRHHATRLELKNLAEFPRLDELEGEKVRFTVEIESREVRKVPDRRAWRATYAARVIELCRPQAEAEAEVEAQTSRPKPWIGVLIGKGPRGAKVNRVVPNTPAAKAGLKPGDEILRVGEARVKAVRGTIARIQEHTVGESVELSILRDGEPKKLSLVLELRPGVREMVEEALLGEEMPSIDELVPLDSDVELAKATRGRPLLLDFWATWCGPCRQMKPVLEDWASEYGRRGLRVVGVSKEDEATVRKHLPEAKRGDIIYALDSDAKVSRRFYVPALPMLVLVDEHGTVERVTIGALSAAEQRALEADIERLLGEAGERD